MNTRAIHLLATICYAVLLTLAIAAIWSAEHSDMGISNAYLNILIGIVALSCASLPTCIIRTVR